MNVLLDPNVGYVLLVGGFVLAILALFSPGTGVLEAGAFFALALAGYAMISLPVNWWALVILLLGVIPFVLAVRRWRHWAFMLVATLALILGSVLMFRSPSGGLAVNPWLAVFVSVLVVPMFWLIGRKSLDAITRRPAFDLDRLVGKLGEAKTDIRGEGSVYVGGELWTAHSQRFIPAGSKVRILRREGLFLEVDLPEEPHPPKS